jgi:hypothetical protein
MSFIQTYAKELVSLAIPFITWALNAALKAKAKLLVATPHGFTFLVQEPLRNAQGAVLSPTQTVHTQSIMLRNAGSDTATGVELVFNWKPHCINFWPVRQYTDKVLPDNRYSVLFTSLAPGEAMGCEIFSINADLPRITTVRSNQCVGQAIEMYPQPVVAKWKIRIAQGLLLAGLAAVAYVLITLLQYLVLATPFR